MKSLKKLALIVLAVVMTSASVVSASDAVVPDVSFSVKQIKSDPKKAIIRITNLPGDKPATLRIKDKKGRVIHKEVISQNQAHAKKYNFSELPAGKYTAELRTSEGIIKEIFTLQAGKINPMYFKPAVQVDKRLIKVAFINRIDTPVSLKLYGKNGELLYEEKVPSQQKFSKSLNVSRLKAGLYSLSLLGHNYVYSKSIHVK